MSDTFHLNPGYTNFEPRLTRLRFRTVYDLEYSVAQMIWGMPFMVSFAGLMTILCIELLLALSREKGVDELLKTWHVVGFFVITNGFFGLWVLFTLGVFGYVLYLSQALIGVAKLFRLNHRGVLLDGEIVRCEVKTFPNKTQFLRVWYYVTSPHGKPLTRWQQREWDISKDSVPPASSTPIKVLYVDERCHVML